MDGTKRSRKIRGRGRARITIPLVVALMGAAPAVASADPAVDFAPGTPAVQSAQAVAQTYWNTNPCGGQITLRWVSYSPTTNASSTWGNPIGQYTAPDKNTDCTITFNSALKWD